MRYVLLAALAVMPIATPCSAVTWGVKAGASISDLDHDFAMGDLKSKTGLTGGAFVDYPFGPLFGLQAELKYVQRGAKTDSQRRTDENGQDLGEFHANVKLDYVEVPVLLRINLLGGNLNVLGGPSVAFLVNDSYEYEGAGLDDKFDLAGVRGTDAGLVVGLGGAVPVGTSKIVVEARYHHGLTDITDDSVTDTDPGEFLLGSGSTIKNRGLTVLAGVAF